MPKKPGRKKLARRLAVTEGAYHDIRAHQDETQLVARALRQAGESQRRPVILIVRGGGLGDNLQTCYFAASLRKLYEDAYIIVVCPNDAGLSAMSNAAQLGVAYEDLRQDGVMEHGKDRLLVNFWANMGRPIHHKYYWQSMLGAPDLYVDLLYSPRMHFNDRPHERMRQHEREYLAKWDEWRHSMWDRSPLSGFDWIRLQRNLLDWQFDVLALPYQDRIALTPPSIDQELGWYGLEPGQFVTFAYGAGGNGIRKEYPYDRLSVGGQEYGWIDVLRYLASKRLKIVQLGYPNEPAIPEQFGVDLRGKTREFAKSVAWVKHARFHVGIEGGLVHYAHCCGTPSVCVCGPTGKTAFTYPTNINVGRNACFDCFWRSPQWYQDPCPHKAQICPNFPSVGDIQMAIDDAYSRTRVVGNVAEA
jgi:hypothetical protein